MAKLVIAGGTGDLGSAIIRYYYSKSDHEVVVLSRAPHSDTDRLRYVLWDGRSVGDWYHELNAADVVINLAGEIINCRFTTLNRDRIRRSRIDATRVIGEAIQQVLVPPRLWINASGISIYEPSAVTLTESDEPRGTDFLAQVTRDWEEAFLVCHAPNTRKVCLRISSVLMTGRGMLKPLIRLVCFGLGGRIGSGDQYVSWIHEADFAQLVNWVIQRDDVYGVIHACSPNPVRNRDLMTALRRALKQPFGVPNYTWATRFGSFLIGAEADLVLSGRRIVSRRLEAEGFVFTYPEINDAIRNLVNDRNTKSIKE